MINNGSQREDVAVPDQVDVLGFAVNDTAGRAVMLTARVPRLVWGVVAESGIGAGLTAEKVRIDSADVEEGRIRALMVRTGRPSTQMTLQLSSRAGVVQQRDPIQTETEGRW